MEIARTRAQFVRVTDDDRGAAIAKRLDDLGISAREFYEVTGIDRKTLGRAIANEERVRPSTYAAIESALTDLEQRAQGVPIGDPDDDLVEFTVEGNFGVRAVVKGPIRDMDKLQAAVARLVREMKGDTPDLP